ncbi:MAG: cyclodeaminase/cyclohydrolase family protein [Eubacteriaceae bacterium]|nr:cyclodeaminase/cyclohydrolase family protein [Eubacteriaceae bacterium]
MFVEMTVSEFTSVLASRESVPGGGGASALIGSIGISLGNMVGELTVGKKKYADVEDEIKMLMEKAERIREDFLALIDGDAEVFAPLAKAYSIPKDDPDRDSIMEEALNLGCSVPMDIMRKCGEALDVIAELEKKGSQIAISDAGCGATACKAAMRAASLNVFINTKMMKDREAAERLNREADELLDKYNRLADEIFSSVVGKIR